METVINVAKLISVFQGASRSPSQEEDDEHLAEEEAEDEREPVQDRVASVMCDEACRYQSLEKRDETQKESLIWSHLTLDLICKFADETNVLWDVAIVRMYTQRTLKSIDWRNQCAANLPLILRIASSDIPNERPVNRSFGNLDCCSPLKGHLKVCPIFSGIG